MYTRTVQSILDEDTSVRRLVWLGEDHEPTDLDRKIAASLIMHLDLAALIVDDDALA